MPSLHLQLIPTLSAILLLFATINPSLLTNINQQQQFEDDCELITNQTVSIQANYFNEACYVYVGQKKSWHQAQIYCENVDIPNFDNGYLVPIDGAEQVFTRFYKKQNCKDWFWAGFNNQSYTAAKARDFADVKLPGDFGRLVCVGSKCEEDVEHNYTNIICFTPKTFICEYVARKPKPVTTTTEIVSTATESEIKLPWLLIGLASAFCLAAVILVIVLNGILRQKRRNKRKTANGTNPNIRPANASIPPIDDGTQLASDNDDLQFSSMSFEPTSKSQGLSLSGGPLTSYSTTSISRGADSWYNESSKAGSGSSLYNETIKETKRKPKTK